MSKFYSLSINSNYVSVLVIEEKNKTFTLLEEETLELSELEEFLDPNNDIFISFTQDFAIDEKVKVPAVIKNRATIKSYISRHLKMASPKLKPLFKYKKIVQDEDKDDEYNLYQVDGVDETEYEEPLQIIKDWGKIKSVSLSKYAILSISNQCIDADAYISISIYGNKILILAVNKKEIIFSRSNTIDWSKPESVQEDMVTEIHQTIPYIEQQFRSVKFSTISINGRLAVDDEISSQLMLLNNIPISVLYPNTLIKNLDEEESQHHISALGNLFIPKELQLFPVKILGLKQFKLISNILLVLSTIMILSVTYFTFDEYSLYSDLQDKYAGFKARLVNTIKKTQTLSKDELQKSLSHMTIEMRHLEEQPLDVIIVLKPVFKLLQPKSWKWKYEDNTLSVTAKFEKQFTSLSELYKLESMFNKILTDVNSSYTIVNTPKSDYNKIYFMTTVTVSNINASKKNSKSRRARVE